MGGCVSLQLSCDKALDQACGCLFGNGNYIHMMEANLDALQKAMQDLEETRDDLLRRVSIEEDKGLQRLAKVQGWFSRVASIESQVSKLLEAKSTETKRLCLFGYCSKNCFSNCEYGKKVSKKLEEVKELLSEGNFEVVTDKSPVPKVEKRHIQTTVGLDSMVEKAWNSLMNKERKVLGLYGMGGVGKTTLLAGVNNKFVNEFDVVIWVVVSKDLQNESIQNQILRRLRLDKEWEKEREEKKASSIYQILSTKKFVLLLDDLWSEVDLTKIGVPHPTCDNGAKIVFTTRSKEVCKDMKADDELKVECLSPDESWELFRTIVGEVTLKRHEDIPMLARKIAEKCYGLPLALKDFNRTGRGCYDFGKYPRNGAIGKLCSTPSYLANVSTGCNVKHGSSGWSSRTSYHVLQNLRNKDRLGKQRERRASMSNFSMLQSPLHCVYRFCDRSKRLDVAVARSKSQEANCEWFRKHRRNNK